MTVCLSMWPGGELVGMGLQAAVRAGEGPVVSAVNLFPLLLFKIEQSHLIDSTF